MQLVPLKSNAFSPSWTLTANNSQTQERRANRSIPGFCTPANLGKQARGSCALLCKPCSTRLFGVNNQGSVDFNPVSISEKLSQSSLSPPDSHHRFTNIYRWKKLEKTACFNRLQHSAVRCHAQVHFFHMACRVRIDHGDPNFNIIHRKPARHA